MNRIGISVPQLCVVPFNEAIERVAASGFKLWEIVSEDLHSLPRLEKDFKDAASSYDIDFQLHAVFSDVNIGTPNDRVRELSIGEMSQDIESAGRLGIETVTVHPGHLAPMTLERSGDVLANTRASVERLADLALESGVKLCLENMPALRITKLITAAEMRDMIDGVDIAICFDVGHANSADQIDAFLELASRFGNVHAHDNEGRPDPHMTIGEGNIDWQKVVNGLSGYKENIIIEAKSLESAVESRSVLEQLLAAKG